ncbi:MAG: hypothetical protein J5495_03950 [Bacteroidales bacterium]|nr:hypothetical protein [Bacteroidales bacterium]
MLKVYKMIVVAALCLFAFGANAQNNTVTATTENAQSVNQLSPYLDQPFEVYCEIVSYYRGLFSNKTTIEIDFGQYAAFLSLDRRLVDENGRSIEFNSMLDAANYMAERGWVFKQAYVVQNFSSGDSGTPAYHWIMGKMITDPVQITEGIRTGKDR